MNISITNIINSYHHFDKEFWLDYKTLEKLHPDFNSIKLSLLKAKRINLKYLDLINLDTFKIERELLAKEWESENEKSKQSGISTHEYIRNLFCTDLKAVKLEFYIDTELYSVLRLESFKKCTSGIFVEHKLEYNVNGHLLIGIPDCFIIHDGVVDIIDWKTNDKLSFKSIFEVSKGKTKKLKYPLSSLDDCNGIHYQLQLSLYMWMLLLLRPDLKPGCLKIVWLKDNKIKKIFPVEYLEKDVEKLIKWHIKNVDLNNRIKECKEIKY